MKRVFSGITSQLTHLFTKVFGRKSDKEKREPVREGMGDAKVVSEFTPAQIQCAKDFIWGHIPPHTRDIIVMEATTDVLKANGLVIEEIILKTLYRR